MLLRYSCTVCACVCVCVFSFPLAVYIPRSEVAGSCGNSMFNLLRNRQTMFPKVTAPSHILTMRTLISPFPRRRLVLFCFNRPCGHEVHLTVSLFSISRGAEDAEHLLMCLLDICVSSLEMCLFRSFTRFSIVLFMFLLLRFKSSLYILDTNPTYVCVCVCICK